MRISCNDTTATVKICKSRSIPKLASFIVYSIAMISLLLYFGVLVSQLYGISGDQPFAHLITMYNEKKISFLKSSFLNRVLYVSTFLQNTEVGRSIL